MEIVDRLEPQPEWSRSTVNQMSAASTIGTQKMKVIAGVIEACCQFRRPEARNGPSYVLVTIGAHNVTGFEGLRGGVSRRHTGSLGMARSNFEMIEVAVDTQCEEGSRRPADGVAAGQEG